jgi:NarL family two-component system response regulator LiaR
MDVRLSGMDGVAATQAIRDARPETPVLVLSSFIESAQIEAAMQAGAIGYLTKDVTSEELVKAIRLVHQGVPILAPLVAQVLMHTVAKRMPMLGHDLTNREREVLALLVAGYSNQTIAERLVVTPATVKFHIRSLRNKLCTSSRTETVLVALKHHLVPTPKTPLAG